MKIKRPLPKAIYIILPLLVLSACGFADNQQIEKEEQVKAIPATTGLVVQAGQSQTITAVGTVRLRRETALGFTTTGKVAHVRYEEGARVKRGALIAALDTTTVDADVSMAAAERNRSSAELARMEKLFKDGWVTKARLEQAQASTQAANARIRAAGFARKTAQLVAPSNGIILTRNIDPGQIVNAGMTAIILGQTDKGFVLRTPVTDKDASRMRIGMNAQVSLSALSGESVNAVISEMDGRADANTGSFEVSFQLPADNRLKSGQIGSATVDVPAVQSDLMQIPATALFGLRAGEGLVFVVDKNGVVKSRSVQIGKLEDEVLMIRSGLKAGETIVTSGVEKLKSGDTIAAKAAQ